MIRIMPPTKLVNIQKICSSKMKKKLPGLKGASFSEIRITLLISEA